MVEGGVERGAAGVVAGARLKDARQGRSVRALGHEGEEGDAYGKMIHATGGAAVPEQVEHADEFQSVLGVGEGDRFAPADAAIFQGEVEAAGVEMTVAEAEGGLLQQAVEGGAGAFGVAKFGAEDLGVADGAGAAGR